MPLRPRRFYFKLSRRQGNTGTQVRFRLLHCPPIFPNGNLAQAAPGRNGGGLSPIPKAIDAFLRKRKWAAKSFDIKITIDDKPIPIPTHKIDNFRNRVGVEVEWNNKTEFYDRDLNNFRLLWEMRVLSVGVIITRLSELQSLFNKLGKGKSYGSSTTHWDKLIPKVDSGGAGGCPLLLVGMRLKCYDAQT